MRAVFVEAGTGMRWAVMLGCLALALAAPAAAEDEGRVVEMVTPLTPELRAVALSYFLHKPNTVEQFPAVEQRRAAIDTIEGAFADLDGDGQPEAFLRESGLIDDCGTQGCWVLVFKKEGGTWRRLGAFMDKDNRFSIMPQKKGGFHLMKTYYDPRYFEVYIKWDGERFIEDEEAGPLPD